MIDRLALEYVRNKYLRIAIVVLWNLSGMVLMWHLSFRSEKEAWPVVLVGAFMFLTVVFVMMRSDTQYKREVAS